MEYYTTSPEVDPWGVEEEGGVLRFWEDSPHMNLRDLLSPILPPGGGTHAPMDQASHIAGQLHGCVNFSGGSGIASRQQPATGGSHGGFATPVLSPATEIPMPITPTWTPYTGQDCSGCCVLTDVVHASDLNNMKLSVHGQRGFIDHAVLLVHHIAEEIVEEKYMADLGSLDFGSVKQFLADYCYCRYRAGQTLVQDSDQTFSDALSMEVDSRDEYLSPTTVTLPTHQRDILGKVATTPPEVCYQNLTAQAGHLPSDKRAAAVAGTGHPQPPFDAVAWALPELLLPVNCEAPRAVSSCQSDHLLLNMGEENLELPRERDGHRPGTVAGLDQFRAAAMGSQTVRISKTGIAAQRERTALMKFEDVAKFFRLPITEAARELKICTTALKKVCRKYNLSRWPHRKVQSSMKRIQSLEASLMFQSGEVAARTMFLLYVEKKELLGHYGYRV